MLNPNEIIAKATSLAVRRGIYFLICNGEIVYVGKSINVLSRVSDHVATKESTSYYVHPLAEDEDLDMWERRYILAFKPKLNKIVKWVTPLNTADNKKLSVVTKAATLVGMVRANFSLSDELIAALHRAKKATGMPMSEIIRRAVERWLKEQGTK